MLVGTAPDFTLTVNWTEVRPVDGGKWRLELANEYESGTFDFLLSVTLPEGSMNYLRLVTRYTRLVIRDARLVIRDARLVIRDARLVMRYPRLVMRYPRLVIRDMRLVMGYSDNPRLVMSDGRRALILVMRDGP
nr:hypothetical protein BaRGS_020866 [Batillaria attramentaria]